MVINTKVFQDNLNGILKYINLYWCKKYEKEAVQKSDINLTLTNQDTQLLSQHYGNGSELFYKIGIFEYQNEIKKIDNNNNSHLPIFIITGSLGDIQTENSIKIWIKEYYPILKQQFANHKIIIAGKNPSTQLYKICQAHKNIEIIANPITMDSILKLGTYFICPVEFGGGIKLRIMDGLKYGMQIITHNISARGYEEFEKKGYLHSYSTPIEFQECLNELTQKDISQNEISTYYRENCSLEIGIKKINHIIKKISLISI